MLTTSHTACVLQGAGQPPHVSNVGHSAMEMGVHIVPPDIYSRSLSVSTTLVCFKESTSIEKPASFAIFAMASTSLGL